MASLGLIHSLRRQSVQRLTAFPFNGVNSLLETSEDRTNLMVYGTQSKKAG